MLNRMLTQFCAWLLKDRSKSADALDPAGRERAESFFADLATIANQTDKITASFCDSEQNAIGHIQLHRHGGEVTIHRIWVATPGQGTGSMILTRVCELADLHGVILKLKVNPLGVQPYPMSSNQLQNWYHRHGFAGGREMTRLPVRKLSHA
jgi:hypothetical protein